MVVVPSAAIETGRNGKYVYVVGPDNTAEVRPVVTGGLTDDDSTVIERGLSAGQRVVTDGQLRLTPGAKVEIKSPDQAPTTRRAASQPAAPGGAAPRRPAPSATGAAS